jgi:hypothetical protein
MSKQHEQRYRYATPQWSQSHTCPKCNDQVYRVPRRFIDHLFSLVIPLQRYKCLSPQCTWEGNRLKSRKARPQDPRQKDSDQGRGYSDRGMGTQIGM